MAFFTPAPVFAIIDFEFPTETIYDAYRRPRLEPIYNLSVVSKPTITRTTFDKGIEQTTDWGGNQLAREFQIQFNLARGDADEIDAFLQLAALYGKWFFWDAGDISNGLVRVRCEQWSKSMLAHNRSIIQATFIETFDYAPRNYGFFIYPVSWTTAI
jgi:phage-related protein